MLAAQLMPPGHQVLLDHLMQLDLPVRPDLLILPDHQMFRGHLQKRKIILQLTRIVKRAQARNMFVQTATQDRTAIL